MTKAHQIRTALPATTRSDSKSVVALGALVTAALSLFFFSFFWNRFLGLRSGAGAFASGTAMLDGILPYRDYFVASTPLNIVKSWLVLFLFGHTFAALRAFDVLERTGLGLLVYFWLVRLFRARDAAVAAIVTIVVSACDFSDPISSYNHDAVFLAVASGFAATILLGQQRAFTLFAAAALAAGFLAALSFDTKQTVGLGATGAIPFVVTLCLLRLEGWRRALSFLAIFAAGWCAAAGVLVLWLMSMHLLPAFLEAVFVKGPAAKASNPLVFLTRTIQVTRYGWWAALPACIALAITIRTIVRANESSTAPPIEREHRQLWLAAVAAALALLLGVAAASAGIPRIPFARPSIFYSFYGTIILLGVYLVRYIRQGLNRREAECCLLAAVSFACAFMLALSWPVLHTMTVPALAFPIAALLSQWNRWRTALLYGICAILLFGATLQKLNDPFDFDSFYDPPARLASATSVLPELRGMVLPPASVRLADGVTRIVQEHSTPQDTIFTYPEFGIFYGLTHRRFPTASGSHNIDVINDEFSLSEANLLIAARPAVLIYSRPGEEDLLGDEKFWRNGKRSGQRDLIAAIEQLLGTGYVLAATFDVPPNRTPIKVYTRK